MAKVFDIALAGDFDLQVRQGDWLVEESTEQHILLILASSPGHWRQSPLSGASYILNFNSTRPQDSQVKVKKQLELDGMRVNQLKIQKEGIVLDGEY